MLSERKESRWEYSDVRFYLLLNSDGARIPIWMTRERRGLVTSPPFYADRDHATEVGSSDLRMGLE